MLDTDGLFRLATSNFKQAEAHLEDAEDSLRKLQGKLEAGARLIREIPRDELLIWEQVGQIVQQGQNAGTASP
ncbi:MAG: hypothetical protein A2137_06000 [Chloroflexi bacterium RBG_16_58_8]|nr:MAG: hypothetical protein A2137_06000 [Chloroflexi bacterium RBG_16_58_8]